MIPFSLWVLTIRKFVKSFSVYLQFYELTRFKWMQNKNKTKQRESLRIRMKRINTNFDESCALDWLPTNTIRYTKLLRVFFFNYFMLFTVPFCFARFKSLFNFSWTSLLPTDRVTGHRTLLCLHPFSLNNINI